MKVYEVSPANPDRAAIPFGAKPEPRSTARAAIRAAADAIRRGELVVFPTETVYGLAADALNESAVRKVIEAKGRTMGHPLPVQIADGAGLSVVASSVPEAARLLAERFWPGPLTLIVPKNERVSDLVTGGRDSVGVRVPDHAVALALLREVAGPIVATSANVTGHEPPTTAEAAVSEVGKSVSVVLDSGPCSIGRASTVVDTSVTPPRILRLGSLGRDEILAVIGDVVCGEE